MDFGMKMLDQLNPETARELIPAWLCGFMELNPTDMERAIEKLASALSVYEDESVLRSLSALRTLGERYDLYRADPVAQTMTRSYMRVLMEGSEVSGIQNIRDALSEGPTLLIGNHLAYCDTQIKDVLLADNGAADLAEKLIVVAGPKVYEDSFRRLASMGLNTLKTAQSAGLDHNETGLSPREIALIALGTVRTAHERMQEGELVLVYGEGSRSRTHRMGSFRKAVRKYCQTDGCRIVPMALADSHKMMPLGRATMSAVPVQLRIGAPINVQGLGPLGAIEAAWRSIVEMLPDDQQPDPSIEAVI